MPANLLEHLESSASTDPALRAELLADPRGTIERLTGGSLEGTEVRVWEEDGGVRIEVDGRPEPARAVSDGELEQVAGAGCGWCMFTNGTWCWFTK